MIYIDCKSRCKPYDKCREYQRGNQRMDNREKLATQGTQDEEKQHKNTTQDVLDTTIRKQTQIT